MRRSIADLFDLPKDVIMDLPRITLVGWMQLLVENHRGIVSFSSDLLVISCSGGFIRVSGRDMEISSIDHEEMLICGQIGAVEFARDGVDG
ncbi:MAG: sporulation protein YqfC [Bacillota bacterium]